MFHLHSLALQCWALLPCTLAVASAPQHTETQKGLSYGDHRPEGMQHLLPAREGVIGYLYLFFLLMLHRRNIWLFSQPAGYGHWGGQFLIRLLHRGCLLHRCHCKGCLFSGLYGGGCLFVRYFCRD